MSKLFSFAILLLCMVSQDVIANGVPKKPKVMVVPEESFCLNNGYYKQFGDRKIPDYEKALMCEDVLDVINSFENIMASYGFPLQNLQQSMNAISEDNAMSLVLTSKDDGFVQEDDLEKLSRISGSDILVKIAPIVSPYGPQRQIKLRVSAIDCASSKTLQSFGPIVKHSAGSTTLLLKAAISDNIESFVAGLSYYFDDMSNKGREGSIFIKLSETCPLNLESVVTYQGENGTLADLIELWLSENTVNGSYTGGMTSRYGMRFDQVRIPLAGKAAFGRQKALTMEDFVKTGLIELLTDYGISSSTHAVGIGKVYLVLGK